MVSIYLYWIPPVCPSSPASTLLSGQGGWPRWTASVSSHAPSFLMDSAHWEIQQGSGKRKKREVGVLIPSYVPWSLRTGCNLPPKVSVPSEGPFYNTFSVSTFPLPLCALSGLSVIDMISRHFPPSFPHLKNSPFIKLKLSSFKCTIYFLLGPQLTKL